MKIIKNANRYALVSNDYKRIVVLVDSYGNKSHRVNGSTIGLYSWFGWKYLSPAQIRLYKRWRILGKVNSFNNAKKYLLSIQKV